MSITSLTIVSPPSNPILRTTATTVDVTGGVFSPNLDKVLIRNITAAGTQQQAVLTNNGGGDYTYTLLALPVISVGTNSIEVKAYDLEGAYSIALAELYVDYTKPIFSNSFPVNGATNVGVNATLVVTFSENMTSSTTIANISLTPNVSGGVWQMGGDERTYRYVSGILPSLTAHTIHIGVGATDILGNPLAQAADILFTTGVGLGPQDPTRRGLNPPQAIVEAKGTLIDESAMYQATQNTGTAMTYNSEAQNAYLNSFYCIRAKVVLGKILDNSDNKFFYAGSDSKANPPILIRPFRDQIFSGKTIDDMQMQMFGGTNQSISEIALRSYLHGELALRRQIVFGKVIDITDFGELEYIPLVLSYNFEGDQTPGGTSHRLPDRRPSLTWNNPADKGTKILHYRIEISKYPSFYRSFIFDSFVNPDAFFVSSDGENFLPMTNGSAPGIGKTRFTCPVDLDAGTWYLRMRAGNVHRGGTV